MVKFGQNVNGKSFKSYDYSNILKLHFMLYSLRRLCRKTALEMLLDLFYEDSHNIFPLIGVRIKLK